MQASQLDSAPTHSKREAFELAKQKYEAENPDQPLLLKPNGVPVFAASNAILDAEHGAKSNFGRTMKSNHVSEAVNEFERTVKAHQFVVGKKTENHTNIDLIEAAKNSNAYEQHFPVKVLYVKREPVRHKSAKTRPSDKVVSNN